MKTINHILAVVLGYTLLTSAAMAETRIAYVNAARLLEEAPQAQAATAILQKEFASREEAITKMQRDVQDMEERMSRDGMVMSESERKKLGMDILSQKRELRRLQEEFREDINIRRNDAIGNLQDLIRQSIEEVGRAGGYDLVFYEGISYANPQLDITDAVLKSLKKMHDAAAKAKK